MNEQKERTEILYCPACARSTCHVQTSQGRSGRGNVTLWRCSLCRRERGISWGELAALTMQGVVRR